MCNFRSGIIAATVTITMRAADAINGLISAMRDSAPPYEQTHITSTQLLNDMLREVDKHIEQAINDIRETHRDAIVAALDHVGKNTDGIKRYERTMYMLMRDAALTVSAASGTASSKLTTPAPASPGKLTPAAYSAANALALLMALYRMRCTYRIGLSRFLVYEDDGITSPVRRT